MGNHGTTIREAIIKVMDTLEKILVEARGETRLSSRRDHEGIE